MKPHPGYQAVPAAVVKAQPPLVEPDTFAEYVASISSLTEGDVRHALADISHAPLLLLRSGQSVRLEGLGLIMPGIDTQGRFVVRLKW